ncbi:hypothetical protein [Nostoc sp.]
MAESLTGQRLPDELPTDWVKSELMETLKLQSLLLQQMRPTDWVKSELMETFAGRLRQSLTLQTLPIGLNRN